jgi:ppGpp synthetase/RelA/SpoT-type nucleotidyltranferase
VKSPVSFIAKAEKKENGTRKYTEPILQIQDQIGARIVTYYLQDVEKVREIAGRYLSPIEEKAIIPESFREFGYEGYHFIAFIPEDIFEDDMDRSRCPTFFELQIKTLFQHAWGEADHDLSYKPSSTLRPEDRRRIAFTAAQAWGADYLFAQLADELGVHGADSAPMTSDT